jgi:Zn-dependent protease with chaperone function
VISYLWQVALHSGAMGLILYIWVHRVGLPSGRTRQHLLGLLLVLPMVTAAVPGRSSVDFGERVAWLDSARLLAIPLPFGDGGIHVAHVVALGGVLTVLLTVWQELVPSHGSLKFRLPYMPERPPCEDALVAAVRSRTGWEHCEVRVTDESSVEVATTGRPGRPRLIVSRGALTALSPEELDAVLTHEHAHWQQGRWWRTHLLFVVRLLQSYNPVALWAFREYCLEDELACDAAAVAGRDPRLLARVLLRVYETTDGRDVAARSALRKRVDVMLAGGPSDTPLPPFVLPAVSLVMLMVLPWLV